jgi:hypothetical protein
MSGALIGCGQEDGPALFAVSGTVTFDGAPVEEGRIQFRDAAGGRAFSAEIIDGSYSLDAEEGQMAVGITASRIIPGKFDTSNPDDDPQPVGEMYIPSQYNSKTTLSASVSAASDNTFQFDLKSAKP